MQTIGKKIYTLRKQAGFSQEELAFKLNVSRQTVSRWEMDAMQPNLENVRQLCEIFNVGADYFIGESNAFMQKTNDRVFHGAYDSKLKKLIILTAINVIGILCMIIAIICLGVITLNRGNGNNDHINIPDGTGDSAAAIEALGGNIAVMIVLVAISALLIVSGIVLAYKTLKLKKL